MDLNSRLKRAIRTIPDYPSAGIMFKDITPLLQDAQLCSDAVDELVSRLKGVKIDAVAGVESRGFLFGFLLANKLGVPFVPIRKAGKLPYKKVSVDYELEYGKATVEMHVDAVKEGWHVLIHDDLFATGGTAGATAQLMKMLKAQVAGFAFIVDLNMVKGHKRLLTYTNNIVSLVDEK